MSILFSFRVSPTLAKLPLLLVHLTSIFCFCIFNFITNVHVCHRHQQILWFLPPFVTRIYFLLLTELFNDFFPLYPFRILSSLGAVQCIFLSLEGLSIMLVTLNSVEALDSLFAEMLLEKNHFQDSEPYKENPIVLLLIFFPL